MNRLRIHPDGRLQDTSGVVTIPILEAIRLLPRAARVYAQVMFRAPQVEGFRVKKRSALKTLAR